jgi:hypothetical protein
MKLARKALGRGALVAGVVVLVAAALGGSFGSRDAMTSAPAGATAAAAATAPAGTIVATYGVGGVLKSDGVLYQWRPESKRWVTIDESFRIDGETRKILPLPVAATDVARMEGFGFIVTRSGRCWLYNLDTNQWENIGRP